MVKWLKLILILGLIGILLLLTAGRYNMRFVVRPDLNRDGCVDMMDFGVFVNHYGSEKGDKEYNRKYDFNKDGVIDGRDENVLLGFYGVGC